MMLDSSSPWPLFRRDRRNTGRYASPAEFPGGQPWAFPTGKGIFSTPVIDQDETIYFGSADHNFYALNADGTLKWQFATGEIIDSAAALACFDPEQTTRSLVFASGDGGLYRLDLHGDSYRLAWKFEAEARPEVSFNRWFEGNVAVGPDGTLYAGNTNFTYYAITPAGELKWR